MSARAKLPPTGAARELLREKGQFWTPAWIAEAMVAYLLAGGHDSIFDPAVGAGAFFHAAKALAQVSGRRITLSGTEIDPQALVQAKHSGLTDHDLAEVAITDFVLQPPRHTIPAIVANPPYIRHHRLPEELKIRLRTFGKQLMGFALDGRAGIHNYFLLRALELLAPMGRLAFILPADTVEGVFATELWTWICRHYRLDAVITFAPAATPFPGVDTNALVFLIQKSPPSAPFRWVKCHQAHPFQLKSWILAHFAQLPGDTLQVYERDIGEALATGLSRSPRIAPQDQRCLGDFARVVRGVATGNNDFFFLTTRQVGELQLPPELLRPALGRTRDVPGSEVTSDTMRAAEAAGRPTWLFAPDGRAFAQFPAAVQQYLLQGEAKGLPMQPLLRQRRPWYKMEGRAVPPFLFAYLGRRNARFIVNTAKIIPLTSFLCVYPYDHTAIEPLWSVLSHPQTLANLPLVGKSYGAGAIKVEPRALERLPIPADLVVQVGLGVGGGRGTPTDLG